MQAEEQCGHLLSPLLDRHPFPPEQPRLPGVLGTQQYEEQSSLAHPWRPARPPQVIQAHRISPEQPPTSTESGSPGPECCHDLDDLLDTLAFVFDLLPQKPQQCQGFLRGLPDEQDLLQSHPTGQPCQKGTIRRKIEIFNALAPLSMSILAREGLPTRAAQ